ncbi:MAG: hypothetical protein HOH33_02030 [Verrucomicrobia bacterium]|nr:hypothetical protein [Verrucomicrobiota bacterium]
MLLENYVSQHTQPTESIEEPLFFRSRVSEGGRIFDHSATVAIILSGPFQQHFDLAFAGLPDGIFPPVREKPYFDGTLSFGEETWPVRMRVRGNSSLQECPFPKLKLKINSKTREGTPLENAREIKIGSHCAEGGLGNIGRLRHELATFREVLLYEAMQTLGFISPRVRRATIEYHDTSDLDDPLRSEWKLTKMAFIMDHVEVIAEHLNGRALEDEEVAALSQAQFSEQLIIELQLFHAMVGNWDYALSTDGKGLWNTEVIEMPDKALVPVAGDFDLAAWVTGNIRVVPPRDFLPELEDIERQIRFETGRIAHESDIVVFDTARDRFMSKRAELELLVNTAEIDIEGRDFIRHHLELFFESLESFR